jgi:hypothetical protein
MRSKAVKVDRIQFGEDEDYYFRYQIKDERPKPERRKGGICNQPI